MTAALAPHRAPLAIVFALLLPPLGVYWVAGPGRDFGIACALTVLGFLPGVAFALHQVLLGHRR